MNQMGRQDTSQAGERRLTGEAETVSGAGWNDRLAKGCAITEQPGQATRTGIIANPVRPERKVKRLQVMNDTNTKESNTSHKASAQGLCCLEGRKVSPSNYNTTDS